MTELFLIFVAAALANNLILDYLLGVSPIMATSRKIETAIGMSLTMLLILPVTSMISYAIDVYILIPLALEYLQLLAFVISITLLGLLLDKGLEKFRPALHERIAVFIPLLLVNTALLGVALLNMQQSHGIIFSLFFGMGTAAGFGIVIVTFSALRERIVVADVPPAFQGAPVLLITLGILSMAFMGFAGTG